MADIRKADFKIISQAFDSWNVQFRIEVTELLDKESLLLHLRAIKREIAEQFSILEHHLIFDGILRKVRTQDFVDVVVRIRRRRFEKGKPTVWFEDGIAPDQTPYSSMKAKLDLYYLDAFDNLLMLDRVMRVIREAGVAEDMVDHETVREAVKRVLDTQKSEKGIVFAEGTFAEIGEDAEVEFFFQAVAEPGKTNEYYSSKRVKPGDLLCRLTPPTVGKTPGRNVKGEELPPRKGTGIELVAGRGTALSFTQCEIVAEEEGVVTVSREATKVHCAGGMKELPSKIHIAVNPVLKIEGGKVLDVNTSSAVEIVGSLAMGSRVLTDADVYVSGDVESGSSIQSGSDVMIEGAICGSSISTQKSVIAQGDVIGSSLQAKERLIIKGRVKDSELHGDEIEAGDVTNSKIVARTKAILNSVDADESQVLSTICVGMSEFFRQRIEDNEIFLKKARANLTRIESALGADIVEQVTGTNVQKMLLKVLARHKVGSDRASKKQAEAFRKLLEAVPPTRELVHQREKENRELLVRLQDESVEGGNMVVIREKIGSKAIVSVDDVQAEVLPVSGPVRISSDGTSNLVVETSRN